MTRRRSCRRSATRRVLLPEAQLPTPAQNCSSSPVVGQAVEGNHILVAGDIRTRWRRWRRRRVSPVRRWWVPVCCHRRRRRVSAWRRCWVGTGCRIRRRRRGVSRAGTHPRGGIRRHRLFRLHRLRRRRSGGEFLAPLVREAELAFGLPEGFRTWYVTNWTFPSSTEARRSFNGTWTSPTSLSPRLRSHRTLKSTVNRPCLAADSSTVNFIGKFHVGWVLPFRSMGVFCLELGSPDTETTTYTSIFETRLTFFRSLADLTLISRDRNSMVDLSLEK
ncbi:hypothetical protein NMG60_11025120 [Bertholletia excelsa]